MPQALALARIVRETATSVWIGGQLFGVAVLPRAARAAARWRDRRQVIESGWQLWSPIALGAIGVAAAASILELACSRNDEDVARARLRAGSALLALASTSAAAVFGEISKRDRRTSRGSELSRDSAGYPVAMSEPSIADALMPPLNALHAVGAVGLVLAEASEPR